MKNNIIKTGILSLLLVAQISCSDDYFDVNTPSNTATLEELRMQDLIAPVIHSTMEGQRSAELAFGNYVQNFVSTGGGAAGQTEASGLWSQVYLYILPNLKAVKEKAAESNAAHIGAISDILIAVNLGIATDTWDNIPYSDATDGPDNNFPTFDTQESIYTEIFTLLNSAISALEGPDNSGFNLGSSDLIYGGDSDQWLRAAYTIKARYQLHLVNKGTVTANEVLTSIANGFTSNDDNFEMSYNEKNINPWYSAEILARSTGNLSNDIASQLVSSMNGDYYPFESAALTIDPRLPLFAENDDEAEWKGFVSGGAGVAPDGSDANTGFKTDGYYTSVDSPLLLISYAEAKFIEAEAAFLANGGNTTSTGSSAEAYTAYLEGIQASMDMYDVDGSDYLADGAIAVGEAGLMLHHIMKEKYINNFLNPETFVDYRRYDFSADVFTGLQMRLEEASDDSEYFGQWFRRAIYPSTELNRNEANVVANQQSPVTPVWWDN
ncbi:SusD/RagB family nutrient-binding outer membrane lipoprotein [Arenibacter echinorum]|uniref:SusD-like starch-binding protein associating with outer membrane n=1 Tax=Arenibacter echinorum TaxID=440515 RepID=A0A327QXE1_9FLAO|nr:SusD/RagB family nutrient-binding outer membrane lipoprotein [Arenibacter echinorum]RAJ09031.1 SusD-like starch-binding protein associating with outer membrane [Arenibacter echinorum]